MDALVDLRARLREDAALAGIRLTFLPFFIKVRRDREIGFVFQNYTSFPQSSVSENIAALFSFLFCLLWLQGRSKCRGGENEGLWQARAGVQRTRRALADTSACCVLCAAWLLLTIAAGGGAGTAQLPAGQLQPVS
jgi:hypothetical protein